MNKGTNKDRRFRKQRSSSYLQTNHEGHLSNEISGRLPILINNDNTNNDDLQLLKTQVAGHQFVKGKESIGMLRCKDGTVLKPITKIDVGNRETRFYEQLQNTANVSLIELKEYCAPYHGRRTLNIQGKTVEFIVLDNITEHMLEPCIIDIKIGRRTWDPLATAEKIAREKEKYTASKKDVAFCIPGFQVYKISTGKLHRYNKEYGKKLNGETIKDALQIFLNADSNKVLCRELVVNILSLLWKIQKWAKKQQTVNLYSTSLLIAYDCKKLKNMTKESFDGLVPKTNITGEKSRKVSFVSPETFSKDSTGHFSGQIAETGPILKIGTTSCPLNQQIVPNNSPQSASATSWHRAFQKLHRSHSFHHNYSDFISRIKTDYATTLKELINDDKNDNKPWIDVKIIDFAHVFPMEEPQDDINFIEGIDNLVQIFEVFLESAK